MVFKIIRFHFDLKFCASRDLGARGAAGLRGLGLRPLSFRHDSAASILCQVQNRVNKLPIVGIYTEMPFAM
jgi:hypothetical protein